MASTTCWGMSRPGISLGCHGKTWARCWVDEFLGTQWHINYGIHWASSALGELWNAAVYLHDYALKSWGNIFGFIWWPNEMRHHDTWYNPAWGAWESNAMKWDVHMRILMGYDISSWQASAHGMRTNAYGFCSSHQLSAIKHENIAWEHCMRTNGSNYGSANQVLSMFILAVVMGTMSFMGAATWQNPWFSNGPMRVCIGTLTK